MDHIPLVRQRDPIRRLPKGRATLLHLLSKLTEREISRSSFVGANFVVGRSHSSVCDRNIADQGFWVRHRPPTSLSASIETYSDWAAGQFYAAGGALGGG